MVVDLLCLSICKASYHGSIIPVLRVYVKWVHLKNYRNKKSLPASILKAQNVRNLYALVAEAAGENPYLSADSPRFHAAMGYREVGRLHQCGEKFGYWLDLTYWEKRIG